MPSVITPVFLLLGLPLQAGIFATNFTYEVVAGEYITSNYSTVIGGSDLGCSHLQSTSYLIIISWEGKFVGIIKVLVAEDHLITRQGICRLLENENNIKVIMPRNFLDFI